MQKHTHDFAQWPFADGISTVTFCTDKVAREKYPVLLVTHDDNGDWQFLDATTHEPGECVLLCLGCVYEADESLSDISDLPLGWSAERAGIGAPWERWQKEPEQDNEDADEDEDEDQAQEKPAHVCDRSPEAMLKQEQKALADIDKFGLQVISVSGDDEHNPFSYSIGIEKSLGMPELIVIGLRSGLGLSIINACYERMKAGLVLTPGMVLDGLLGGDYQCVVGAVDPETYGDYMGWAIWLHKGRGFRALQIVFPSVGSNRFPWDADATESFRKLQPLLSSAPVIAV